MKKMILVVTVSILGVTLGWSKKVYISPTGSDTADGSFSHPFATLWKADSVVKPGDTVFILGGVYTPAKQVFLRTAGKKDSVIVYTNYPGDSVIFDFANSAYDTLPITPPPYPRDMGAITVYQSGWVEIRGISVINANCAGIQARESDHVRIAACYTYNTFSSGINAWDCDSVWIEHNVVDSACVQEGPHEAISIARTSNFEVMYNELKNCIKEGVDVKESSANGKVNYNYIHDIVRQGLYVDSWDQHVRNIEMAYNVVHHCMFGFALSTEQPGGLVDSVFVHHNLIYNCPRTGMIITTWGSADELRRHVRIINNTVYHCGWERVAETKFPHGGIVIETENLEDVIIRNNIFSTNCSFQIAYRTANVPPVTVDYNMIDGYNDNPLHDENGDPVPDNYGIVAFDGDSAIKGDAGFVDPAAADFHLLPTSLAINAGHPDSVYNDSNGTRNDLGAFPSPYLSREDTTPPPPVSIVAIREGSPLLYPNPVQNHQLIIDVSNVFLQGEMHLYVTDLMGRKWAEKQITSAVYYFDTSSLPGKGTYLFILSDGHTKWTTRVMVP